MRRRAFITLLGGAAAALLTVHHPPPMFAQESADWVTAFPRTQFQYPDWLGGRKVAASYALFVEEFVFAQGRVLRPYLASRSLDLVNEAFRQYAMDWGITRVGGLFKELDVPL